MTDHPRFTPVELDPDDAHRRYHGGVLVEWVLRSADAVIAARCRSKARSAGSQPMATPAHNAKTRSVVVVVVALVTFGVAIVLTRLLA